MMVSLHNRKWKIRAASMVFVMLSGVVIGMVISSVFMGEKKFSGKKEVSGVTKNEFSDIVYTSYDEQAGKFSLKSSKGRKIDEKNFNFTNLVSTFRISEEETGTVSADETQTRDSNKCRFKGNVKLSTESGLLLETDESFVDLDKKTAEGNTDITIIRDETKFSAKKYYFDMSKKEATLTGQVNGIIGGDIISTDKLEIEFGEAVGKDLKNAKAFGNSVYTAPQYVLKSKKIMEYNGDEIKAEGAVFLHYKKRNGDPYDVNADFMRVVLRNNLIQKFYADGKLEITTRDSTKIRGNHGVLENDILTVTDNVIISGDMGNVFCAKATLDTRTNEVKVYNSRGIVKGHLSDVNEQKENR